MTTILSRAVLALVFPLLFLAAPSAQAASDIGLSVSNITMVPKPPTCEARATKKVIRSGGSVDIVWKSRGAVKMTGLTQGDQEWPADGRQRFAIAVLGKHLFPMTFVDRNGVTATCTAKVFVHAKRS